jgi:uncharacterized membrane protein YgcG
MLELHDREQYFWDGPTVDRLADFVAGFPNPCCLCTPLLGRELEARGVAVRTLDTDERFADLRGFRRWDVYRPEWLGEEFGLIVCDPPFFRVSLAQLFAALRVLARNDFRQPLLLAYLTRRSAAVQGTFTPFGLTATGFRPGYVTVRRSEHTEIELFGNLGDAAHARLAGGEPADQSANGSNSPAAGGGSGGGGGASGSPAASRGISTASRA